MGPLIYPIFGHVKEMHVGPVATITMLLASVTSNLSTQFSLVYSTVLCLTIGIMTVLIGLMKLCES
jgi:MFS superfamily sulfate permease-like transporter